MQSVWFHSVEMYQFDEVSDVLADKALNSGDSTLLFRGQKCTVENTNGQVALCILQTPLDMFIPILNARTNQLATILVTAMFVHDGMLPFGRGFLAAKFRNTPCLEVVHRMVQSGIKSFV